MYSTNLVQEIYSNLGVCLDIKLVQFPFWLEIMTTVVSSQMPGQVVGPGAMVLDCNALIRGCQDWIIWQVFESRDF